MEDDHPKKNGRRPQKNEKMEEDQSTKINLIGCDTIVNSPSWALIVAVPEEVYTLYTVYSFIVDGPAQLQTKPIIQTKMAATGRTRQGI